jgi:hypothetical protein
MYGPDPNSFEIENATAKWIMYKSPDSDRI